MYCDTNSDPLSLLPDDYLASRDRSRWTRIGCAIAMSIALGFAVLHVRSGRELAQLERRDAQVCRTYADASARAERAIALLATKRRLLRRAASAEKLMGGVSPAQIVAEITAALPSGSVLTDLSIDTRPNHAEIATVVPTAFELKLAALGHPSHVADDADAFPAVAPSETTLRLCGVTQNQADVDRFRQALQRSSLFHDVQLLISEIVTPDDQTASIGVRRFQLLVGVRNDDPSTEGAR